jgi:hypothetical protein
MTGNQAYRRGWKDYYRGVPLTCCPLESEPSGFNEHDELGIDADVLRVNGELDRRCSVNYSDDARGKAWHEGWLAAKANTFSAVKFAGDFETVLRGADWRIKALARAAWSRHENNPDSEV